MEVALLEKMRARGPVFSIPMPGKNEAGFFIGALLDFLFFHNDGSEFETPSAYSNKLAELTTLLKALVHPFVKSEKEAATLSETFFAKELPRIYDTLWQDAEAAYAGDPAAQSIQEVLLAYPGFFAIAVHRIAHYFEVEKIPVLPRLFSEHAHEKTGIDIHPGAQIGKSFFMDHGTGIVIGGTSIIADNVKIYQGVTLGALSVDKSLASTRRHPTIEEGVVIYAGATILGGKTVIGRHSVIGGNTWIVESVLPYSVVYNKATSHTRPSKEMESVIDFII